MKKFILLLIGLLIAGNVYAEGFICYDSTTKKIIKRVSGDCKKLGLCSGENNTGLQSNCIVAKTRQEWIDSKLNHKKVDVSQSVNRIVDWTQAEIDAETQAKTIAKKAADTTAVNNLSVSVKDVFTSFIKVYNSKMPVQYRITAKELKDQIKLDKGL